MDTADREIIPSVFQMRSQIGMPSYRIFIELAAVDIMSVDIFSQVVDILNFNHALCLLMEYTSFVKS